MADGVLSAEVHLTKVELSRQIGRRRRSFSAFRVFGDNSLDFEVKLSNAQRSEVEVRRENGCGSWLESSWRGFGLLEGRYIGFIAQKSLEVLQR